VVNLLDTVGVCNP